MAAEPSEGVASVKITVNIPVTGHPQRQQSWAGRSKRLPQVLLAVLDDGEPSFPSFAPLLVSDCVWHRPSLLAPCRKHHRPVMKSLPLSTTKSSLASLKNRPPQTNHHKSCPLLEIATIVKMAHTPITQPTEAISHDQATV